MPKEKERILCLAVNLKNIFCVKQKKTMGEGKKIKQLKNIYCFDILW